MFRYTFLRDLTLVTALNCDRCQKFSEKGRDGGELSWAVWLCSTLLVTSHPTWPTHTPLQRGISSWLCRHFKRKYFRRSNLDLFDIGRRVERLSNQPLCCFAGNQLIGSSRPQCQRRWEGGGWGLDFLRITAQLTAGGKVGQRNIDSSFYRSQ